MDFMGEGGGIGRPFEEHRGPNEVIVRLFIEVIESHWETMKGALGPLGP